MYVTHWRGKLIADVFFRRVSSVSSSNGTTKHVLGETKLIYFYQVSLLDVSGDASFPYTFSSVLCLPDLILVSRNFWITAIIV